MPQGLRDRRGAGARHPRHQRDRLRAHAPLHAEVPVSDAQRAAAASAQPRSRSAISRSATAARTALARRQPRDRGQHRSTPSSARRAAARPRSCARSTGWPPRSTARSVDGQVLLDGERHPRAAIDVARSCAGAWAWCSRTPQPLPRSIYENLVFGPRLAGMRKRGRARRARRGEPARGAAVGRGEGSPRRLGARALRRAAAATVHRAHRSRSSPRWCCSTSRARASTRSPRYASRRRCEELKSQYHLRARHQQHQAGGARRRPRGVLPDGRAGRGRARPTACSPRPRDQRTNDYISGRFG